MAAQKKRFPSFSFWMGFTSSTGAPVSLLPIEKVLLSCEVEINVQIQKTAEKSFKWLFPVLKDHNSSYVTELVEASFQATIADTADQLSRQSLLSSPMNCSTEKVHGIFYHEINSFKEEPNHQCAGGNEKSRSACGCFGRRVKRNGEDKHNRQIYHKRSKSVAVWQLREGYGKP